MPTDLINNRDNCAGGSKTREGVGSPADLAAPGRLQQAAPEVGERSGVADELDAMSNRRSHRQQAQQKTGIIGKKTNNGRVDMRLWMKIQNQ